MKKKGLAEGIEIGTEKGIQIGTEKGIQIGTEKGIQIGTEKERKDFAKLLRSGKSIEELQKIYS